MRMAGEITKIIIYSLLIVMSTMLSVDFYIQGRRLLTLILFTVSLVIGEVMK